MKDRRLTLPAEGTILCLPGNLGQASMRLIYIGVITSFALGWSAAVAQQSQGGANETIGHPPPLPGPPPVSEPSLATPHAPSPSTIRPTGDLPNSGYIGAYGPAGPATPYSTGPLPEVNTDPGLNVLGPDNSTKSVKAVPCARFARGTDGSTTCVGIPDTKKRR
jgi:hypothetical protein